MEKQFNVVVSKREALVVIRALERMKTALENHVPEQSVDHAYETEQTLELIRSVHFKLSAVEAQRG